MSDEALTSIRKRVTSRRRAKLAAVGVTVLLAVGGIAGVARLTGRQTQPRPLLASTATTEPVSTETSEPVPTEPPPSSPPPPMELIDCGDAVPISGWPTTMVQAPGATDCIVEAFEAGTLATFSVTRFAGNGTDQDNVERWTYLVTGQRLVSVTIVTKPYGASDADYRPVDHLSDCHVLQSVPHSQVMLAVGECAGQD